MNSGQMVLRLIFLNFMKHSLISVRMIRYTGLLASDRLSGRGNNFSHIVVFLKFHPECIIIRDLLKRSGDDLIPMILPILCITPISGFICMTI